MNTSVLWKNSWIKILFLFLSLIVLSSLASCDIGGSFLSFCFSRHVRRNKEGGVKPLVEMGAEGGV